MFLDMACQCGAALQLDGLSETFVMLMAVRFADAHTACGFVTPLRDTEKQPRRDRRTRPLAPLEDDED